MITALEAMAVRLLGEALFNRSILPPGEKTRPSANPATKWDLRTDFWKDSLQQNGFIGQGFDAENQGRVCQCGAKQNRGVIICASAEEPPPNSPIFVLMNKPERKPVIQREIETPDNNPFVTEDFKTDPEHKSGYVAVIGKPNVGKSTLLNGMIGQKLSIVTEKPQTTRHRILGICSGPKFQMVIYDTPGVIAKQMHKLDEMMMKNVRTAAINADALLVVADICQVPEQVMSILDEGTPMDSPKRPTILVLNKKDLLKPGEIAKKTEWYEKYAGVDKVIPISAKFGHNVDDVKTWLVTKLPFGPAYYPRDIVSEHPERFFVAEILREKIFQLYHQEIPYSCQVNVIKFIERKPTMKSFVQFEILVEKETQKAILLGKDGRALKTLATAARLDIEDFIGKEAYLEIHVRVKENWRKDEKLLDDFGYGGKIKL